MKLLALNVVEFSTLLFIMCAGNVGPSLRSLHFRLPLCVMFFERKHALHCLCVHFVVVKLLYEKFNLIIINEIRDECEIKLYSAHLRQNTFLLIYKSF